MDNNFIKPEAEIVLFPTEDVILTSEIGEWWQEGPVEQTGGGGN